jgi:hypothetical protein
MSLSFSRHYAAPQMKRFSPLHWHRTDPPLHSTRESKNYYLRVFAPDESPLLQSTLESNYYFWVSAPDECSTAIDTFVREDGIYSMWNTWADVVSETV